MRLERASAQASKETHATARSNIASNFDYGSGWNAWSKM